MKQKTTSDEIILEVYRRMYAQAEPKGNIDKIIKSGEGKMPGFFMAYYLSSEKEEEIIDKVLKEFKVPKFKWSAFNTEILLGAAPCSVKERTKKERVDYVKRLKKFLKSNVVHK